MHGAKDTLLLRIIDSYFGQPQILYNAGIKYFILLTVPRELTPTRYSFLSFLILTLNANIYIIAIEKTLIFIERGSEAIAKETATIKKYNTLLATSLSNSSLPTPMLKQN
jgi:hypothetical protein